MPSPRAIAVAVLLSAAAVGATAPAASAAPSADRAPVRVHIARNHTVVAPATVRPGIANLHNSGHGAIVAVETRRHVSTAQAAHALNASATTSRAKIPGYTILGVIPAHRSLYTRLDRGTLFFFNATRGHLTSADVRRVGVHGPVRNADVAGAQPVVIDHANRLTVPATVSAHGLFRLADAAPSINEVVAVRVGGDVNQSTVDAFVAHPSLDGFESLHPSAIAPIAVLFPGQQSWVPNRLSAGRYVVIAVAFRGHGGLRPGAVHALVVR